MTRTVLVTRGPGAEMAMQGEPAPSPAWINVHKKLVACTERRTAAVGARVAFVAVITIVGLVVREAWTRLSIGGPAMTSLPLAQAHGQGGSCRRNPTHT